MTVGRRESGPPYPVRQPIGGSQRAGSHGTEPRRPGSHRTEPRRPGSHGTEPRRAGSHRTEPRRAGSHRTGPRRAGSHGTEPRRAGSHWTEPRRAGSHRTESQRAGSHGTEPRRAGSHGTEPRRAGHRLDHMSCWGDHRSSSRIDHRPDHVLGHRLVWVNDWWACNSPGTDSGPYRADKRWRRTDHYGILLDNVLVTGFDTEVNERRCAMPGD